MKFFILFLATAATASASLLGGKKFDIKEDGSIVIQGENGKQIFVKKPFGPYGERKIEIDVTGPNTLAKRIQIDNNNLVSIERGVEYNIPTNDDYLEDRYKRSYSTGGVPAFNRGSSLKTQFNGNYYGGEDLNVFRNQEQYGVGFDQYDDQYFYNVLFKIFDREFMGNVLNQQKMYNQYYYGQKSIDKTWDVVFAQQGIFDHQYLVQIINNQVLRTWFVQQGFFDRFVLDQILYAYKTQGVFDQYLLQRLVNTQTLKYFFIKHGVSVYDILGQTSYKQSFGNTIYNKGIYGYNMLEKFISAPFLRNAMIQCGIFNKNILDQILFRFNTQGFYDEVLLRQLVNKQALYDVLVQYGVVDQTVLRQLIDNEYLGLNYLYKNNIFQQTPRMNYNQVLGVNGNAPEYTTMYGGNFFKNFLYGKQNYGYNQGPYSYGKWYHQYPITQQVY